MQQIEFVGQLKTLGDGSIAISTFVRTILEKIKETRTKFSQGSVTVLWRMANYQETRVKLTNTRLNKLKSTAKNKTGTILRLNKEPFEDDELPHELFLTTR